jgi:hypothetical protein
MLVIAEIQESVLQLLPSLPLDYVVTGTAELGAGDMWGPRATGVAGGTHDEVTSEVRSFSFFLSAGGELLTLTRTGGCLLSLCCR